MSDFLSVVCYNRDSIVFQAKWRLTGAVVGEIEAALEGQKKGRYTKVVVIDHTKGHESHTIYSPQQVHQLVDEAYKRAIR